MRRDIWNLSRRELLKALGIGIGASIADSAAWPRQFQAQSSKITPRKNARNVVVVQNCGAMSPPETLDFNESKWTAKDLDIQKVNSDFYISKALFPHYDKWAPRASLVRSMMENSLVHFAAWYHSIAGRALNAAIVKEIPAFGSVIAMELEPERRESDTFPTFLSIDMWNIRCQLGSGMLPPRFGRLDLNTSNIFDTFGNESGVAQSLLEKRFGGLTRLTEVSPARGVGEKADEYEADYAYAYKLLMDPRFKKMLGITDEEKKRYGVDKDPGAAKIGLALLLARNTLAADAGARFIWVSNSYRGGNGSFDNHNNLYGRGALAPKNEQLSIYESCPRLDMAFGNFIEDLSMMPGKEPGKKMLDETMVVLMHEFGRTPDMNSVGGRDHYGLIYTDLYMGGGVKPGRVIGKTNNYKLLDVGWDHKEQPMKDHLASTIYSALGIDYSKKIVDTPSGRAYEYQQTAPLGGPAFIPRTEIHELFA
jgi:uncharacterized protein DUF1501